jgi:hypothetical protein
MFTNFTIGIGFFFLVTRHEPKPYVSMRMSATEYLSIVFYSEYQLLVALIRPSAIKDLVHKLATGSLHTVSFRVKLDRTVRYRNEICKLLFNIWGHVICLQRQKL